MPNYESLTNIFARPRLLRQLEYTFEFELGLIRIRNALLISEAHHGFYHSLAQYRRILVENTFAGTLGPLLPILAESDILICVEEYAASNIPVSLERRAPLQPNEIHFPSLPPLPFHNMTTSTLPYWRIHPQYPTLVAKPFRIGEWTAVAPVGLVYCQSIRGPYRQSRFRLIIEGWLITPQAAENHANRLAITPIDFVIDKNFIRFPPPSLELEILLNSTVTRTREFGYKLWHREQDLTWRLTRSRWDTPLKEGIVMENGKFVEWLRQDDTIRSKTTEDL